MESRKLKNGRAPEDEMPVRRIIRIPGFIQIQEIHAGLSWDFDKKEGG